ncbi:2'-5' RNA ligase family protein [Actinomadura sp. KC06]|uniref:2'-5' RNA ligase family protein n=1 Tax=Actinomadura sp. KC06 TaxID=2530369 RepID=UPI00140462AF|nr:2'-5' RNA ligase family protein [Actinomadura sp. KC06]
MDLALVLPMPADLSEPIERFRARHRHWASRPMRSWPHLSIKGGAGLSEDPACLDLLRKITAKTAPFEARLGELAVFPGEGRVLHLRVESPGWTRLHRTLVDTIARHTDAQMHPLEIAGWIPHVTVLRLTTEALAQRKQVFAAAQRAGLPSNTSFTVRSLHMERLDAVTNWWNPTHTFDLTAPT